MYSICPSDATFEARALPRGTRCKHTHIASRRLAIALPVEFVVEGASFAGYTRDLSASGVLVRFSQPVLTDVAGKVRLRLDTCVMEFDAKVAHREFLDTGLIFRFGSEAERQFIETVVKLLSKRYLPG